MKKEGWSGSELPELDNYNNASGVLNCAVSHPFNAKRRQQCREEQNELSGMSAQAELLTAQAILAKSQQAPAQGLSPMAITGIVVASLLTITLMVVVIKRTRARKA